MPKKPAKNRDDLHGFQAFVDPKVMPRFRAACDLDGRDRGEIVTELLSAFADRMGIPAHAPSHPQHKHPKK